MFSKEARWSFNGQLLCGKRTSTYTPLRWHLTENNQLMLAVSRSTIRNFALPSMFALEHSGQPFLMKVEIEGRLEKWYHQAQSKLKFGMHEAKVGKVFTLVDFEGYRKFPHGLYGIARGLPMTMEMEKPRRDSNGNTGFNTWRLVLAAFLAPSDHSHNAAYFCARRRHIQSTNLGL